MPEGLLTGLDLFFGTAGPSRFRSVVYPVCPTLEFFIGMNATNEEAKNIGLPKSTVIISPMGTADAQRVTIEKEGQYRLLNHARGKSVDDGDEKSMTDYDSGPTQGSSTDKAVLKRFDGPVARMVWRERILKVWHSDRDKASYLGGGDKAAANKAIRSTYDVEFKDGIAAMGLGIELMLMGTHPDFPTGAPTDTSATQWDALYSIYNMIDTTNTYLGINRSTAANAYWRGNKVTAARNAVLEDLLWEYWQTNRTIKTGGFANLVVCGNNNYQKFWNEAQLKGYKMISNDQVPNKLQFGAKQQVIQYLFGSQVIYVLCDPNMPEYDTNGDLWTSNTQTFSYGHVYILNTKSFTIIFRGGKNFAKTKWINKAEADPEGGEKADVANLDTELQVICEIPSWNMVFGHVG
jgi:hypothetical protein